MTDNSITELADQIRCAPTLTGTKIKTKEDFSNLMRERIREENWHDLFTAGGCYFFALVLHEELKLPLFYFSPPDSTEFRHVFVMRDCRECIDYCGKRPVENVAKRYAEWADEKPRPTSISETEAKIKGKELGAELECQIFQIATKEFARRKQEFL